MERGVCEAGFEGGHLLVELILELGDAVFEG